MTKDETKQLIQHISTSTTVINSMIFNNKAVVYKITDSRLDSNQISNKDELRNILANVKNNEIITNLLKQLKNRYEVVSNMKVN